MRSLKRSWHVAILVLSLLGNVFLWHKYAESRTPQERKGESDVWGERPVELRQRRTVMVIDSLLLQVNLYASLTGKYPDTMDLLQAPLDGDGPNWPLDCFGNTLKYIVDENEVRIVSAGVDGVWGSEDDIVGRLQFGGLLREIESPIGKWTAEILCGEHNL